MAEEHKNRAMLTVVVLAVSCTAFIAACDCLRSSEDAGPPPTPEVKKDEQPEKSGNPDPGLRPSDSTPTPEAPVPTPEPTTGGEAPLRLESTLASMRDDLVVKLCISCHSDATTMNRHVNLNDLQANITNGPDTTPAGQPRKVIRAGCPDASMFYISMKNGDMPKDPSKRLSEDNLRAVAQWIRSLNPDPAVICTDEPPD